MKPEVRLVSDLSTALKSMAFAAKLCYGSECDVLTEERQLDVLDKVLRARHWSILEHAYASFYILGVSRNFTHQLVRHRHMSFAQQSFHYTFATDCRLPFNSNAVASDIMHKSAEQSMKAYKTLIDMGIPREEARHVLPTGISTRIMATANLREWLQFVNIRICKVNCSEIRDVSIKVKNILLDVLPFLDGYIGPACYTEEKCHEGKKGCKVSPCISELK